MGVEITDVRIFRIIGSGRVKAYANVTLGGEYAVHGVKVLENEKGLWVSMPRQKSASDGTWRDVFHPITSDARERLISAVLKAYEEFVNGSEAGTTSDPGKGVSLGADEKSIEAEDGTAPGEG